MTSVTMGAYERLRPSVELADPVPRLEGRKACAALELPILTDADPEKPGGATDPQTLALPISLHHRRVRGQGWHGAEPTMGADRVVKRRADPADAP